MTVIGSIIKRAITLRTTLRIARRRSTGMRKQEKTFLKLLRKAQHTLFGQHYGFEEILLSHQPIDEFRKRVPLCDYDNIYEQWWSRALKGEENVTWPGKVQYFALSSGTSGAPSKHIPVTQAMIRSIRRTSVRQILTLAYYDLPPDTFEKGILMVGGSTDLEKRNDYYEGDLSGINAAQIPFWFQAHYKPGKKIAKEKDWESKLEQMVEAAPTWDIGIIVGVPAWILVVMERIIKRYKLNNIHDIWPNLSIYVHGGVFFEPYKKSFELLLGRPVEYIETYLASEGFIAYQSERKVSGMELVLNNGIFFEFIPFNEENFDAEGRFKSDTQTLLLSEVKLHQDYALVISTCAGAWRYLIGDTIRFTDLEKSEIIITGRIKHFMSLCGEHLSVDNMNQAMLKTAAKFNVSVPEFTLAGTIDGNVFAHHWFIGTDRPVADTEAFRQALDDAIKEINDDYKVERRSALKTMNLKVLPSEVFYDWLKLKGKEGGQHKFPRVLKRVQYEEWLQFLAERNYA